jgi:hypothetical protein
MAEVPGFGAGLGQFIGAELGAEDLSRGTSSVNRTADSFSGSVAPYNTFGQGFLPLADSATRNLNTTANQVQSYGDFMKSYTASPGAEYTKQQALEAQNESAASKGGLLSGTNLRALTGISENVSSTFANQAYDQYLKGNQQQFGQLESALGGMFKAIGVGETATGQQAGVSNAQIGAQSSLAQAQAKNDASKGSGLGSMFGGLGSLAAMF